MSEAKTNVEGCIFCQIGQNEDEETELLYDDIDFAVFRWDFIRTCPRFIFINDF